jgi:tetratricopeptide (TPR) repeat protein
MRIFQAICAVVFALLFLSRECQGQAVPEKSAAAADFSREPFVLEHSVVKVRWDADGKGERESYARVKIQSESAVRQFGLLVYPYMASSESLDLLEVEVRKPDGSVVETPASEIQEVDSAVSREAPMYTDQREKHIAVKALAVGDLLEVRAKWVVHDPVAPGHFWFDYNFDEEGICLDEELEMSVPRSVAVKIAGTDADRGSRDEGDRHIYLFRSSHLERTKAKRKEDEIPDWEKNFHGAAPPKIRISSFTSWAEVGAWYNDLQKSKVEVTPRIRSTAEDLTKGKNSEREKIQAIYDFVASRFRYIGIDLGAGRYTPHSAEDVLANRFGDCKDKHTLFAALLQAVGIRAYPALVSIGYKIDPSLPSASLFNHVITAIPQGNSYLFLDTTPEVAPFGLLLRGMRNREALVIPAEGPAKLLRTPADPPQINSEKFQMEASLDSGGTLDGKTRFENYGDGEVALRAAYRNTPQNRWTELTQSIMSSLGYGGTVSEVSASQPEKLAEAFWVEYKYHRPEYSDWKDHQITLPFPPILLPELNDAQKKSKEPLPLGSPQDLWYETSIKMPQGIQPQYPPGDVTQKTGFAEYTATYAYENGVLRGKRHLFLKGQDVPGAQREAYSSFVKAVQDDYVRMVQLVGDFDANNPLHEGRALLAVGKNAEAAKLLEKAIADGVDTSQIDFTLGAAYMRLSNEEKAVEQFRKVLTDKESAEMLNDVAYEYAQANRHLEDALDYATRAEAQTAAESLKADLDSATPADFARARSLAAEWDTLGWVKFRSGDLTAAQKFIEAAWLELQSGVVGEHLVEVYEKAGKKREADRICRMALAAPGMKNDYDTRGKLLAAQKRIGITNPKPESANSNIPALPGSGGAELSEMRAVKVPMAIGLADGTKSAIFAVAIGNDGKPVEAQFVSGDNALKSEAKLLTQAKYNLSFPDDMQARILRKGLLSCSKYTKGCTFVFFLTNDPLNIFSQPVE